MNCAIGNLVTFASFVLKRQIFHREVDAFQFAARARADRAARRAAGEKDRIELALEFLDGDVHADVRVRAEHDAFFVHDVQPPVEDLLFHLEFGNSVPQQAADTVCPLEHGDPVSRLIQLRRGRKTSGSGTDDGYGLTGTNFRPASPDQTFFESAVDDARLRCS